MQRQRVKELFFIAPLEYVPGILAEGILAHNRVGHNHEHSIANPSVQDERANKRIPGRAPLHDFANVYFNGRNPMLFGVLGFPHRPPSNHERIVVLSVKKEALDIPGAVVADHNAAYRLVRFFDVNAGLEALEATAVFRRMWVNDDPEVMTIQKKQTMAELLVQGRIGPEFIDKAYVCCNSAKDLAGHLNCQLEVNRYLFFNEGARAHD